MSDSARSRDVKKVGLASVMGTTIEYYDFFIYGTAAALVFGRVFFPESDPLTATLLSFATFGVAFVARPLGGIIFGHFGDRIGRKKTLVVTLLTMGIATVLIGLVPSYTSIGVAAPVLLVVLRFVQGLALGGEYAGAVLMTVEHSPAAKRGFYSSWVQTGAQAGLIIANVVYLIVGAVIGDEAFLQWGWRVPFVFSFFLVALGLFIRVRLEESPEFQALRESNSTHKVPAFVVFRHHLGEVVLIAGAAISFSVTFYATAVFGLSYGISQGFTRNQMLTIVITSAVWVIVASIFFGSLSDRIGRKPLFLLGSAVVALAAWPWVAAVDSASFAAALAGYFVILTGYAMTWGTIGVMFSEAFAGEVRYSGLSIGYTFGAMIGGALTPIVLTTLVDSFDSTMPVVIWVAAAAIISGLCALPMKKVQPQPIRDEMAPST